MGCAGSKHMGGSSDHMVHKNGDTTNGGSSSNPGSMNKTKTQWKVLPSVADARETTTTLTGHDDEHELRVILKDPVGQKHLGNYAKELHTAESFFCWVEIQEFQSVPSLSFRRCVAKHIYEKYVKRGGGMGLGSMSAEVETKIANLITQASTDQSVLVKDLFQDLEKMCLLDMIENTFMRFKVSSAYGKYKKEIKETYNKITTEDFEYLEPLGAGGFGRVAHARKKSTGRHYAMKIQLKTGLLGEHRGDLSKLAGEKVIFQACNHPYIVDMDYSFTTEHYAIIVLALVRGGDLAHLIKQSKDRQVPEEQVVLYAAEIALALNHLHEMGLLYRDLKPSNVLLTETGHVKLADMGLAGGMDLNDPTKLAHKDSELMNEEEAFEKNRRAQISPEGSLKNLLTTMPEDQEVASSENQAGDSPTSVATTTTTTPTTSNESMTNNGQSIPSKFTRAPQAKQIRRKTTVGTRGYMAPEMLRGKLMHRADRPGYNHSVDYWSLGVTVFELLCGYAPFRERKTKLKKEDLIRQEMERNLNPPDPKAQTEKELSMMLKGVPTYPDHVSPNAISLMNRLLDTNEETRLGCTDQGFVEVMNHPFFESIDWDKLLVNHVQATYLPKVKYETDKTKVYSFEEIMHKFDMQSPESAPEWYHAPPKDQQKYFDTWDYISINTLKAELGIAGEMDESNRSYKVIQLTGG